MSTSLVIDASFAVKLILPGPRQSHFKGLMRQWQQSNFDLYTTTLFIYEVTSAISKVAHFNLITLAESNLALQLAQELPIQIVHPDEGQVNSAIQWTRHLKRAATYDSFYLALAQALTAELWTADKRLYNAVNENWIHLVE